MHKVSSWRLNIWWVMGQGQHKGKSATVLKNNNVQLAGRDKSPVGVN